jgi:putative transcriptional regulator
MMKVTSDLAMDDATHAALASGRAEPSLALFLDTVLEMRGVSGRAGEAIAGAVLEGEAPSMMSPNALDLAFAAIERGPARAPKAPLAYPELAAAPLALQALIRETEARRAWDWSGPGIKRLPLIERGGTKAEVIRIDAGVSVPWHTHKGQELTLCLVGEFSDSRAVYGPGDFSISDPSIRHRPTASMDGPVYALAVTDAGLRFEGVLGALQKLFGG